MNYKIKNQSTICGFAEIDERKFNVYQGKLTWFVADQENAADNIYMEPVSSYGMGARLATFKLVGGGSAEVKGPWLSNANSLFQDTGVDIRDKHRTFGVISKGFKDDTMIDVVYADDKPKIGVFDRIEHLAQKLSNEMGCELHYYRDSQGGSTRYQVEPEA